MSSSEEALKEELLQTKNSLTEVLDEVVYFEQQFASANERAQGVAGLLSASGAAHKDALDAVINYANTTVQNLGRQQNASEPSPLASAATAHQRAQEALRSLSAETQQCASSVATLGFSGVKEGWHLAGRSIGMVLSPPPSTPAFTFAASPGPKQYQKDSEYANIRINELVSLLEAERKTVATLREELSLVTSSSSFSVASSAPLPSDRKTYTPYASSNNNMSNVRVSRRGSVEIQVRGDENGQDTGGNTEMIEALRERVRELEIELSNERVKATGAERDRASASRDRDAALMDLERAERERESAVQAAKSSGSEAEAAREKTIRLERDVDIARRGKFAAESQLSEALVERDRAKSDSRRDANLLEQARTSESEAVRQRDEATERAEAERIRAEEMTAERERALYREDELKRALAAEVKAKEQEVARADTACHERDSARQERDDLKVDVDSLRKRLETAERERAFSLGDAHEAQRQRDAAQAQVVEAVEEGERREKQRRAALARAQQAEDAAAVAQRARKEAEDACRALDAAENKARIEAESERRQRQAMVEQMKILMTERDSAVSNVGKESDLLKTLEQERDRALESEKRLQRRSEELERLLSEEGAAMNEAQQKLQQLVERASDADNLQEKHSLLTSQLEKLQSENQRLRHEIDDRTRAMREASYQQLAALQNDNETIAAASANSVREKNDMIQKLEVEAAEMRSRIGSLEREISSSASTAQKSYRELEEKHAYVLKEKDEMRNLLAQKDVALNEMKQSASKRRNKIDPDLRKALDAVADRDATIAALKQTLTSEREAKLLNNMKTNQPHLQMTPGPNQLASSIPGSSVPRARVRIHRSGSIVIQNNKGDYLTATSLNGGNDNGANSRMSSPGANDEVVQLRVEVSLLQEEKKKLEFDNKSLKARLSLKESFAATTAVVAAGSPVPRSPSSIEVNRLQAELRRLQSEAQHTSDQARSQVESMEDALYVLETKVQSLTRENDNLREELRRTKARQKTDSRDRETIISLRAQLESTQLSEKEAQRERQKAVTRAEQVSKGTKAARNREARLERELNNSKERESELEATIERLSRKNSQLELEVHTLNQRVRQARQTLSELQSSGATELESARTQVKELQRRLHELSADSESRNAGMTKRTEEIAAALRKDLEEHQALLKTERDSRREYEEKVAALENERQQLAKDMQEAARHLRLVALQKSQVSQQLEEMHSAIADLEEQLVSARTENDRLRKVSANINALAGSPGMQARESHQQSGNAESRGISVHVNRKGSINISSGGAKSNKSGASNADNNGHRNVPLPKSSLGSASRNIRVKAHRSGSVELSRSGERSDSDLVAGQKEAWSLGSDDRISSIRRGTYFGTYTQAQANDQRRRQRTRSTVDRRFLTPSQSDN